ncbi:phosphoenolpyruvate--protein phosphotransferase [Opitutus sp. GAS368]|jgi:phosphotransferase system enzyme I (PtsI)|uniref:phosphoenolpyruvate--protein phosphotransferase n=1 Tax=Opitutus sp. GAS368 TaxID=1882749 RepID=UPI00087C0635|nr:phosphoenolpyruvate--protein phosphotransferase [Opitutus sp. GAS368]SDS23051.1 phosphotransferase system, enzyme I, PtsI [Opitutus sp. GAS368]
MESTAKSEITIQGIAASRGIAYGQVFLYLQSELEIPQYTVDSDKRVAEVARFEQALLVTRQQISQIQAQVTKNLGEEEALIFDAHQMVLEDQALIGETIRDFQKTGLNIETCFNAVAQRYIQAFAEIDDEYLRERAADIKDVAKRVLHVLLGQSAMSLTELVDKRIIVAQDISPSEAAGIDRSAALGIVTDAGSRTSHAVIVARSMKIPAVVGTKDLTTKLKNDDWVMVDGYDGCVIINPTEQTLFRYGKIRKAKQSFETRLMSVNELAAETLDGVAVSLRANIEKPDEVALVQQYRAAGVGLYRTEFLFLSAPRIPTEEQQYAAYREIVGGLAPAPVTIRTLDVGGDKPLPGDPHLIGPEANPFLGFRAIRMCLENPAMFKNQLRAILRASAHGKVEMMYPMISGPEELDRANALLAEAKAELTERGQAFDGQMSVGAMIEIPSAAIAGDLLAGRCDFFSIGTNDLIQYLLAIDRGNSRIAHLYDPTHPAVLRTLKQIVDTGHAHKLKVSVCGEMAGDSIYVPLLLGLGVDELSMTPTLLPSVKFIIRAMKMSDAKALATEALQQTDARKTYALVEAFFNERVKAE